MAEFPITLLLDHVGVVFWEQKGLYYHYHAQINCPADKFYRLYLHQGKETISLGVFSPQNELRGKIAANKICMGEFTFTLTKTLWHPKHWDDLGRCIVVASKHEDLETLIVRRYGPLPQELMPYVCFLRPTCIENLPCLTITLDKQGRPLTENTD